MSSGTKGKPDYSLTKAVEDVSQHGYAQTEALKEKQKTLSTLQVHFLYYLHDALKTLSGILLTNKCLHDRLAVVEVVAEVQ